MNNSDNELLDAYESQFGEDHWAALIADEHHNGHGEPSETPSAATRNGHHVNGKAATTARDEPTTWEPVPLGPYLRGEIQPPKPSIGLARSDGQRFIYPGREHAVIGETESGKSWFALACVAAEIKAGRRVLYIHYEEADPTSTVERLRLLGVTDEQMTQLLRFAAPTRPLRIGWLDPLLDPAPSVAVHDGVNEAMSLCGNEIKDVDGASAFRRALITPCLKAGAATIGCDHMPMNADPGRRNPYGSVHKLNALNGAAFMLHNTTPFGRGLRGVSNVFITKDRPGELRSHGKPSKTPGITFIGTLAVDATMQPDFKAAFYAPRDGEQAPATDPRDGLADTVYEAVSDAPGQFIASRRMVFAAMRKAGSQYRDDDVRAALDDLVVAGRLVEVEGKRGATGYRVLSASQESGS